MLYNETLFCAVTDELELNSNCVQVKTAEYIMEMQIKVMIWDFYSAYPVI